MAVVVKHRIWRDGRIRVDGVRSKVLRDTGGWYLVRAPSPSEDARVLYRPVQDLIVVEQGGLFWRVLFQAGEASFTWEDRPYHIASMVSGDIRIDQESRPVARGVVTVSGLRLETCEPELLPIIRALAWGLTLRSEELSRDEFRGGAA